MRGQSSGSSSGVQWFSRWRRFAGLLPLCGVLALAACEKRASAPPEPRPVVSMAVHPDESAASATYPGEVDARYSTPLSFRVNGKIIDRTVRLGDTVKPGQVLARLDPVDYDKNAASAAAQVDAARHRLVFAKQQLERDTAQAEANLIARAQLEQTQDAFASAAAQRDQAEQQLALAENQRRYTELVSDHAGTITAENADTGQNVQSGQPVYQLAWSGSVDVLCDLPENAIHGINIGETAQVSLPALPGKRYRAQVREVATAADPASRTWRVRFTLEQPDAAVRLGMSANVVLAANRGGAQAAFTIPATALFHDGNAPAIWVVRKPDNVLQLRRVTVARYDARTITVTSGIADNDQIVVQGVHTVTAGQKVRPVPPLHPEDFAS
ncbi:efflux RND transporter periplasmic adaptor subunit [Paraburkholderia dinghuensis]|uniref:Efflux RND transporter periplasmic adaptor subunit n=1 Tax=Paraburkholderia dinghuensis TaxID=2305225 RepID=A0A3N6P3E8_9BURK|nr:efflux RND transporter periplasmic adaptor subunit [Paraburkholderia dinghuensis]RQH08033.1 efflux RND transporter periplasmic adaptor subunit [Paraburkholderia dinghuensis]